MLSSELEICLNEAFQSAREARHEFMTVEHLLLAIIDTVRAGDPFVAVNAQRLQAIAWAMLALQGLGVMMGAIAKAISTPAHPIDIDAGFSTGGWLAVLLTFVLARVFAHGTAMRDDLQGTV